MKSFPKILTIFFLTVFILQIICLFFLLAAPVASQASGASGSWGSGASGSWEADTGINFTPQVGIPGAEKEFQPGGSYTFVKNDSTAPIAKYIRAIYNYGIGIIGILAAVVLMIGGVMWIIAGGNTTQIGEAKAWIGAALTGLILALTSYLILNTINPALVNLQITNITGVAEMKAGCCTITDATTGKTTYEEGVSDTTCINEKKGQWEQGKCPVGCCIIKGIPNDVYEDSTAAICYAKPSADVTFLKDKTCPTPCCLYNYISLGFNGGYYGQCLAKTNFTQENCRKLANQSSNMSKIIDYMLDGKCERSGLGYRCASK